MQRLKWVASAMPSLKAELVDLCTLWKVPLPDIPQNMRVIDLQDALRAYDAELSMGTIDPRKVVKSWANRKITFGQKHRGKTYEEVSDRDTDYCDWVLGSAARPNEAMKQFIQFLELREEARKSMPEPEGDPRSQRPKARARRTSSPPPRADERMADAGRKRLPSDDSWDDGTV